MLVFTSANKHEYPQSIALAEWIIFRNQLIFKSQELYENKNKVLKHLYDCIRIISLRICSSLNKQLIALSLDNGQHREQLEGMIVKTLIQIVNVTSLFWKNDKHAAANIYNIEYTFQNF